MNNKMKYQTLEEHFKSLNIIILVLPNYGKKDTQTSVIMIIQYANIHVIFSRQRANIHVIFSRQHANINVVIFSREHAKGHLVGQVHSEIMSKTVCKI